MDEKITRKSLQVKDIRAHLSQNGGQAYWRSLDELVNTDEFQEMVQREFPDQASEMKDPLGRRNFLRLMGASLAFGGLTGCTIQPPEKIVPFVRAPENLIPGKPLYFASAMSLGGVATGILVESHMGRPTHIEGNPEHPASLGGVNALIQASILDLYDPDRAQVVKNAGMISTWDAFSQTLGKNSEVQQLKKGAGLRILTETVTSPTLGHQLKTLLEKFPEARWHQYEPAHRDNVRNGSMLAYGEPINTYYDFSKADVILSLDADFTFSGPGNTRYARDFSARRRVADGSKTMNRLYAVESTPSATGSIADHRLALSSGAIEALTLALAEKLGVALDSAPESPPYDDKTGWLDPLVRDLKKHTGSSLVVAGDYQPPAIHALVHAINQKLGNVGKTVHYTEPLEVESVDQTLSLTELVQDMRSGQVDMLIIVGGNPVFNAPVDLDFASALEKVEFRAHMGLYENETSAQCHWHLPESHYLEAWGDARAYDGTISIIQPLIQPLYGTKSSYDLVGTLNGQGGKPVLDILREYWLDQNLALDFEKFWQQSLHDGLLANTALAPKDLKISTNLQVPLELGKRLEEEELELVLRPDATIWDGRFANNGWLQETPNPITKLTWDNAALLSPDTAERLGLKNEQVVQLDFAGQTLSVPVWLLPGQAQDVVTLHLGYGQTHSGRVGNGAGFNAYSLRPSSALWGGAGLKLNSTFEHHPLASTQDHHSMEGRHLVRHGDLEQFEKHPTFAQEEGHNFPEDLTLYSGFEYNGNAWGMTIDLNACIGCNACSVACQSENNIPIVGKDEVLNGREMSWIRIDRYYTDLDEPEIYHQPVPCQQCENAPCELVCPVTATSHSAEGLNDMVYNRCVGTRYCSNNCPYKVRRFNFLQYADRDTESLKLQNNPDVTVRYRGVMEKCTYCVQRINSARIDSKKSGNPIRDGQIKTACEQACPTEAIAFGDINDSKSKVGRLKASPLNYEILNELNTRPRTSYLARIKNPNPEIVGS